MHLAVVLADYTGTVAISNRIELRGRETETPPLLPGTAALAAPASSVASPSLPNPGVDVVDIPTAHVELAGHAWRTTVDYSAFAIMPDLETGQPTPQVLNTGAVGAVYEGRTVHLGILEFAQYGEQNPAYLFVSNPTIGAVPQAPGVFAPPNAGSSVQLLASPVSVLYGSSRTDLTSQVAFSRRWTGTSLVEFAVQGGADAASQLVLPIVEAPRAEATLKWSETRNDALETKVTAMHSDASVGPCFTALITPQPLGSLCEPTGDLVQGTETWRHRLSRHTEAWIGAGPAFVLARLAPRTAYEDAAYPVFLAGFQYLRTVEDVKTVLRLDAQLAPLVDLRTGIVDDRAQGTLTLSVPLRDVTLTGALSGTRSVETLLSQPVESVQGSFEMEARVDPELSVGAGVRYVWQDQAGIGVFATGLAFVQATFRTRRFRF
jgi:hypothetical protein